MNQLQHLLTIRDLSPAWIEEIFVQAAHVKARPEAYANAMRGKQLAMIFQKPSTRTRVSFEAGMAQMGGSALYLNSQDLQLNRGEPLSDTARTLSRYVHGLMVRLFRHEDVLELAHHSTIPVINGLDDLLHPCQGLTDYFTMREKFGRLHGLRVAYVGDGNNVCHSLIHGAAHLGVHLRIATPQAHRPLPDIVEKAQETARSTGAHIELLQDPYHACENVAVVYTDTWVSMHSTNAEERVQTFLPYQVNDRLLAVAPGAIFMHCLPAHRGQEVTAEVIDGKSSVVFDQAENRLHVQKSILMKLLLSARENH